MFAATNVDDLLVLAVFFGRAAGRRGGVRGVVAGQYLGFLGILAVAVVGSLGAGLLPDAVVPYLGLYAAVFLVGVGVWCAAGWFLATRPLVAAALARWGHVVLPVVLIGIGLVILIEGGAFGL